MGQECFDMFGPWSTCGSSIICQEGSLGHSHHLGQGPGGHLDSVRFGASNMTSSQSINIPLNMWTKRKLPFSGLEHAVLMKWEFFFFPSSSNIYCLDMIALPSSKNTKIYGKSTTWRSFSRGKPSISIVFLCLYWRTCSSLKASSARMEQRCVQPKIVTSWSWGSGTWCGSVATWW